MYKAIIRSTRPNTNINFLPDTNEYRQLLEIEKQEGRLLEESTTLIDNGLTERRVFLWADQSNVLEFNKKQVVLDLFQDRRKYNNTYNIVVNLIGEMLDE